MEAAFGICMILIVFGLMFGGSSVSSDKINKVAKIIDKELSKEFKKRDDRIEALEKQIEELKGNNGTK